MSLEIFVIILLAVNVVILGIMVASLEFRHAYLRQKLLNRMTEDEIKQMNNTDKYFWSFIK